MSLAVAVRRWLLAFGDIFICIRTRPVLSTVRLFDSTSFRQYVFSTVRLFDKELKFKKKLTTKFSIIFAKLTFYGRRLFIPKTIHPG